LVNKNGQLITKAKIRSDNRIKKLKEEGRFEGICQKIGRKVSKTINKIKIIDGRETTIIKETSIKRTKKMKEVGDDGLSIYDKTGEKISVTVLKEFINDEGIVTTIAKERGKIFSDSITKVGDDGLSKAQKKSIKAASTMKKNGTYITSALKQSKLKSIKARKYNIMKNGKTLVKNVLAKDIREIHSSLQKSTEECYIGNSSYGLAVLVKHNREFLHGIYVEEVFSTEWNKDSVEEILNQLKQIN